jgi:alpha-beta hydrolase superfamily lysophospholipase
VNHCPVVAPRLAVAALLGLLAVAVPAAAAGRPVTWTGPDGTTLAGMLYETGRQAPGVVLVHMLGRSKDEWAAVASDLQEAGVTTLAMDLRGNGSSSGSGGAFAPMTGDVRAAAEWLAARGNIRPGSVAIVGASLGATLAALAAVDAPSVRAVALISPALDYRGLRLDAAVMKKLGRRAVWLVASTEDPYALRTVRELAGTDGVREQRLSAVRAHGTALFSADPDLTPALLDWLRRALAF